MPMDSICMENQKYFDEPHSPEKCRKLFSNYEEFSKKKFFIEKNMYSYFLQCKTIHECLAGEGCVLEIGPGGNVVRNLMRAGGYEYKTLDSQASVHPDIQCDVNEFNPNYFIDAFDLVASFQMFEHIPYQQYIELLGKLRLITKKYLFLSVPYKCRHLHVHMSFSVFNDSTKSKFPNLVRKLIRKFEQIDFLIVLPFHNLPNRKYRQEFVDEFPYAVHFWEIGRNRLSEHKFLNDIRRNGFRIVKTFHNNIHPYHFFVLAEKMHGKN